jgi:hypothetical protein
VPSFALDLAGTVALHEIQEFKRLGTKSAAMFGRLLPSTIGVLFVCPPSLHETAVYHRMFVCRENF